jgi:hypothetical protein
MIHALLLMPLFTVSKWVSEQLGLGIIFFRGFILAKGLHLLGQLWE